MPDVPQVYKTVENKTIYVNADTCPAVVAQYDGKIIRPSKVEVIRRDLDIKGPRAVVKVTGFVSGYGPRNTVFNLYGYPYGSPPQWLVKLIREHGYDGEVEVPSKTSDEKREFSKTWDERVERDKHA